MLFGLSWLKVMYCIMRDPIEPSPGTASGTWKIVSTLSHCRSCSDGARSPTSISKLEFTHITRAICSARSTYRAVQYIESASRASIGRVGRFIMNFASVLITCDITIDPFSGPFHLLPAPTYPYYRPPDCYSQPNFPCEEQRASIHRA